jgi:hypothetical protein
MLRWYIDFSEILNSSFGKKTHISLIDIRKLPCPSSTQLCQSYCHSLAFLVCAKTTSRNRYFIWPDKLVAFILKIQVFWNITLLWLVNSPAVKENGLLGPEREGGTFFLNVDIYLPVDTALFLESSSESQWQYVSSQYLFYGTPYPCRTF